MIGEIPLDPLSDGRSHFVFGDDLPTHIAWDDRGNAFYTADSESGLGNFGTIDMDTFITTRALSNTEAAHGMEFNPFLGHFILSDNTHIIQIDSETLEVVSILKVPDVACCIDQGRPDGRGHLFIANNNGELLFVDYAESGRVGAPSNFVATPFIAHQRSANHVTSVKWHTAALRPFSPVWNRADSIP